MDGKFLKRLIVLFLLISCKSNTVQEEFYQLKIYTFSSAEQIEKTEEFIKEAYLPALKRMQITNVGIFKKRAKTNLDTTIKLYVLIPYNTASDFYYIEEKLQKDVAYMQAGEPFFEASYLEPPYKRLEFVLMKSLTDLPILNPTPVAGPRQDRVYELRSYESPTESLAKNKIQMFNEGGEIKIFEELGFNTVFCGEVISGSKMPNLMYMTTFSNQESRDEHWATFFASEQWTKLKADTNYQNNVSHIDRIYLYPTEYSDY